LTKKDTTEKGFTTETDQDSQDERMSRIKIVGSGRDRV
jgi:hypothetical protein